MGRFKSELTWSFSRSRLFKECRRAYYYHYYASWGGWEAGADEFIRKAYVLKNMRNIDAWIGDIVHQIIKWILENKISGKDILAEEAFKKAKQMLTRTWEQSRAKIWMKNIKYNLNLFEHYYKRELTREELVLRLQKVTKSIRNIYNSGLLESFSGLPRESFLSIDELDSFNFEGVKSFAVPDFAVRDGAYTLYDWKTGKPSENDVLQLSCYVLYATRKWGVKTEEVRIVPVYLVREKVSLEPIKAVNVAEVKQYIRDSLKEMKSVLSDVAGNKADIASCPKTNNSWRCERCKFQEICE
ncbi:MAG: PD-(D/E)XK nuclease family protein [Candidatus Omnitrophica bacterium]|nr:PD-(D/E)XK nuclease family protein [Candidatus Omnitrophota bacterium]